jgi:hypothetical protein
MLNQTYSNIELLISFDQSVDTDMSKDIVAKASRRDRPAKHSHHDF